MKAGTFKAELKKEEILWYDRKRVLPFGLPWTFTKYTITDARLKISRGLLKTVQEDIQLYRIADVTFMQNLGEKLCRVGTLEVISSDASQPKAVLRHVKKADKVRDLLLQSVEEARKRSGVNTSEIVGTGMVRPGGPVPGPHPGGADDVPPPPPGSDGSAPPPPPPPADVPPASAD